MHGSEMLLILKTILYDGVRMQRANEKYNIQERNIIYNLESNI